MGVGSFQCFIKPTVCNGYFRILGRTTSNGVVIGEKRLNVVHLQAKVHNRKRQGKKL